MQLRVNANEPSELVARLDNAKGEKKERKLTPLAGRRERGALVFARLSCKMHPHDLAWHGRSEERFAI